MPGVADRVRRTQLKQEKRRRRKDMEEIANMLAQNRLHEADERQLETLKLVTEMQKIFGNEATPADVPRDLADVIKKAVTEAVSDLPVGAEGLAVRPQDDPARPSMKHVSLDLTQDGKDLQISHGEALGKEKEGTEGAGDKLKKLREIKGTK